MPYFTKFDLDSFFCEYSHYQLWYFASSKGLFSLFSEKSKFAVQVWKITSVLSHDKTGKTNYEIITLVMGFM